MKSLGSIAVAWRDAVAALLDPSAISPIRQRVLLALIVGGCAAVRLATIGTPAIDRSPWKEIDYLQISSNYARPDSRFVYPEIHWPADEPRYTAMELPLVPYASALSYSVFGYNAFSARLPTLLAFVLLPIPLFRLVRRELGPAAALLTAFAAAVMPLYHPFGRLLLTEPSMILMSVLSLDALAEWVETRRPWHWFVAMAGFSLAVALKLEPLYLLLPLSLIAARCFRARVSAYRSFAALILCAMLLPSAWYTHALHLGRTSMDVFGVLKGHDKFQTVAMLRTAEWWRTIWIRVSWEVLGGRVGILLTALGLAAAAALRRAGVLFAYLMALLASFVIVAEGNLDGPYRQLPIVPPLAAFVALGALSLAALAPLLWRRVGSRSALAIAFVFVALLGAKRAPLVRGADPLVPHHKNEWRLAQEIRKHAEPGTRLVALGEYTIHHGGNDLCPVLYHYSGTRGWTLQAAAATPERVAALASKGASLLAVSAMSKEPELVPIIEEMKGRYEVLYESQAPPMLLVDLRRPKSESARRAAPRAPGAPPGTPGS